MRKSKLLFFLLVLAISLTSVTFADTLKYGSTGAEVKKLQTELKKLGYFSGSVTGFYGSQTQAAVKKFQAKKGISTTGTFGPLTSKALYGTGTSSSAQSTAAKETLKKAQTILQKMGLYTGKIDGLYGKLTSAAVKEFQKKYGMNATGVMDKETETKILSHFETSTVASRSGSSVTDGQATRIEAVNAAKAEAQAAEEAAPESEGDAVEEAVAEEDVAEETVEAAAAATPNANEAVEKEIKVEVLDWWTQANKVFARGSNAKVIDVRTGKSFNIKRTYGGNHADCEALTKEDTKIIKEIWGGFSWTRRPVIVVINGRYLAASMAAMPHAGLDSKPANVTVSGRSGGYGKGTNLDTVKNNGMDGHFDIHFKNSRTHGTNKVDSAHQKAVQEAAKAKL